MTRFATTFIALMILPLAARANGVMDAVLANDVEQLRSTIAAGETDVNGPSGNGTTALHVAAAYGYDEITAELIAAGAAVDARDHLGNTPLILAAQSGQLGSTNLLLAAGAEKSARSIAGGDAMSYARGYGHRDLVDALTGIETAPSPMRYWPAMITALALALLAAVLSEIHRSVSRKTTLAPVAH